MPFDYTENRRKFTAGLVNKFVCETGKKESLLWDTDEKTLCIRARASGKRSYYYQSRYNKKVIKIRIGSLSDAKLTFDHARNKARDYEALVKLGVDPRLEIKRKIAQEELERNEVAKSSVKFRDVLNSYIAANKDEWSKSHLTDYQKAIQSTERGRNGILYQFRDAKLTEISFVAVLSWLKLEKKYRPTAAAKGFRLLRAVLNWAESQPKYKGVIDVESIIKNTDIKKALPKPKARKDTLIKTQVKPWFDAVRGINNPVISASLQAMLLTGARRNEVLSLKWSDIDFTWRSISIKDKVEGKRTIPLTPYVAQLLADLPKRNKWVFSSNTSESGRLTEPYIAHANALENAELLPLSIHGLRRSFSNLSEWVECPVGVVAQIMGHKPSATAEKHYKDRPLDLLQMWHNKIEAQILEFAGIAQPEELADGLRVVSS